MPAKAGKNSARLHPLGRAGCFWAHQRLGVCPFDACCEGLPAAVPVAFKLSGRVEFCPETLKHHKRRVVGPQAHYPLALALAQLRPRGAGIGHFVLAHRLHRRGEWVPLDDEGHLAHLRLGVLADDTHEIGRVKAGGGAKQQRHGDVATAITAVRSRQPYRHGQHTEVNWLAADLQAQDSGVDVIVQINPRDMRVHAFAQGGRRGHGAQAQGTDEVGFVALTFDGIEVVFAQAQLTEVALQNVAAGDATTHREGRDNEGVDVDALQILTNPWRTGLVAQVVGQLFENEIGHAGLHFQGERHIRPKLLI